MESRPCKRCGADVTFTPGISSAVGNQPLLSHAECPSCGAAHYLVWEGGGYDLTGDEQWKDEGLEDT